MGQSCFTTWASLLMGYPIYRIRLDTRIDNGPMVVAVTNHTLVLVASTSEAGSLELINGLD